MGKKKVAEEILATGGSLFVQFNPHKADVPQYLKTGITRTLQYGINLPVRIPDLYLNDDGISATLRFNGSYVATFVPWSAVQAMHNDVGIGQVWDASALVKRPSSTLEKLQTKVRPALRLIQGGKR